MDQILASHRVEEMVCFFKDPFEVEFHIGGIKFNFSLPDGFFYCCFIPSLCTLLHPIYWLDFWSLCSSSSSHCKELPTRGLGIHMCSGSFTFENIQTDAKSQSSFLDPSIIFHSGLGTHLTGAFTHRILNKYGPKVLWSYYKRVLRSFFRNTHHNIGMLLGQIYASKRSFAEPSSPKCRILIRFFFFLIRRMTFYF